MLHVCLILHASQSTNLGVGALTVAQIDLLREAAARAGHKIRITLLDWCDEGLPCVDGPDLTIVRMAGRDLVRPSGLWAHLRQADLVIDIGAGDSFADIYGAKRLRRIFWLKFLTHLARRPLVLAPQTFGPFTKPLSRFLARLSLSWSALVFARDPASASHLREIGVQRDVGLASDVALKLAAVPLSNQSRRPAVGINVSGLLMSGGYDGKNQFGLNVDYPKLMHQMIEAFLAHPDAPDIHLIAHVISPDQPVENDLTAIRKLHRRFPQTIVAPSFATPQEAKGYIAGMSFFVGARMHSCIAAFSSGVPVVPMAYSRKFSGLFGALGYNHIADCRKLDQAEVLELVMEGYEKRADLARHADRAAGLGRQRLSVYERSLGLLMRDLNDAKQKPVTQSATGQIEQT